MKFLSTITAPLTTDYPNLLAAPGPLRRELAPARWMILGLLVLCLAPRAWMSWRVDTLCPDGVLYVQLAQSLDRGDIRAALEGMHLNTYPVILLAGHRLGMDWQAFGEFWGVLMGTLTVWPLFNWTRRQFDDRVALAGGILYAVHPKLIEWSPELVRDPTFWFLLALSLDCLWRAIVEVRLRWFVAAGAAMTFCVLTRFEGLFLIIPVVGWLIARTMGLRSGRRRLWCGVVACLAAFPAVLLAVNLWLLHDHGQFESFRVEPWQRAQHWFSSWQGQVAEASGVAVTRDHSLGGIGWLYVDILFRGITPAFGLLMLIGYVGWRRTWDRRDHIPLFLFTAAVAGGIWIHVWFAHVASSRYALAIVLVSTRCAALGLLAVCRGLAWGAMRISVREPLRWIAAAPIVAMTLLGCGDALSHYDQGRSVRARLGRWVQAQYGPQARIVCTDDLVRVVGYYAQGQAQTVLPFTDQQVLLNVLHQQRPEVVALTTDRIDPATCLAVLAAAPQWGLDVSKWGAGLPTRDKMMILTVRPRERVVQAPADAGPGLEKRAAVNYYTSITVNDRNPLKRLLQRARLVQSGRALTGLDRDFAGTMLDIGTGDGLLCRRLARRFPRALVFGYEPVPSLQQFAALNVADLPNVRIVGDLQELLGWRFEYLFCLEVLEHLPRRETHRLLDQVRLFSHEQSTIVFGVPNELYAAGLCKGLFRAIRRWGSFDARLGNIARATLGRPPLRRPLAEIWPGCRYYYHHLGFDYRRLGRLLAREFTLEATYGSPLPGVPVAVNSEVFFVCRPRAVAAPDNLRAA